MPPLLAGEHRGRPRQGEQSVPVHALAAPGPHGLGSEGEIATGAGLLEGREPARGHQPFLGLRGLVDDLDPRGRLDSLPVFFLERAILRGGVALGGSRVHGGRGQGERLPAEVRYDRVVETSNAGLQAAVAGEPGGPTVGGRSHDGEQLVVTGLQNTLQNEGLPQRALGDRPAGGAADPQTVHVELHGCVGGHPQPAAAAGSLEVQAAAEQERSAAWAMSDGSMTHGR